MKLSEQDVLRLGTLSRIEIAGSELPALATELNRILVFAEVLREVNPELPGHSFDFGAENFLREDEIREPLGQEGASRLAPATENGFLKVPRTVDTGGHGS